MISGATIEEMHHAKTYPRHRVWKSAQLVRSRTRARWLGHDIRWDGRLSPWLAGLNLRLRWSAKMGDKR